MKNLGEIFQWVESAGAHTFILPFLLMFAIIYGILQKADIIHEKKFNFIIAIALGLIATSGGYYSGCLPVLLPALVISIVIFLIFALLVGIFIKNEVFNKIIVIIITIVVFTITLKNSNRCNFANFLTTNNIITAVIIIITAIIIIYIFSSKPEVKSRGESNQKSQDTKKDSSRKEEEKKKKNDNIDNDLREYLRELTPQDRKKMKDLTGPETSS